MTILPFVHEGLGNSSYVVGLGEGSALLVDPDRTIERYLAAARANDWAITHVFETHLHADFISGALEVRAATGAEIFVPEAADVLFGARPIAPGDRVSPGGATMHALATPGHTPEHLSFVLKRAAAPPVLFSGGSLLAGGAARTDLIAPDQTAALTRAQFRSITRAFRDLEDETLLLPTHGGGSFCSAGSAGERTSTLGHERRTNPLLAFDDEDSFADWFPTTFPAAPAYFFRLRAVNRAGPRLRELIAPPPALPAREFDRVRRGAVVLDLRPQAEFMRGHIPGALSIAFRDAFATWLGWLVPPGSRLLFVLGAEPLRAVLDECLLVGYEQFAGVLGGGMAAWESAGLPVERANLIDARAAKKLLQNGAIAVDVRERDEFQAGFIPGAIHVPLGEITSRTLPFAPDAPIVAYCGHGERSATGLSILAARGFRNVVNLDGGIGAWAASNFPLQRAEEGGLSH